MSINSEIPRLNLLGDTGLAVIASFMTNGIIHPIGTIKNCMMAENRRIQKIPLSSVYNGYLAICAVDAAAFGTAYAINNMFRDKFSSIWCSLFAGILSAPIVAFGEGLMANRQVNALPYSQVLRRAMRTDGLTATVMREVPFTCAVFCMSPILQKRIQQEAASSAEASLAIQAIAGVSTGAFAGFVTTPADLLKTRVQTSEQALSLSKAFHSIVAEGGYRGLFRGASMRVIYVGLAAAIMNVINNKAPHLFPQALQAGS